MLQLRQLFETLVAQLVDLASVEYKYYLNVFWTTGLKLISAKTLTVAVMSRSSAANSVGL